MGARSYEEEHNRDEEDEEPSVAFGWGSGLRGFLISVGDVGSVVEESMSRRKR